MTDTESDARPARLMAPPGLAPLFSDEQREFYANKLMPELEVLFPLPADPAPEAIELASEDNILSDEQIDATYLRGGPTHAELLRDRAGRIARERRLLGWTP